jgi:hypothetical protein
MPPPQIITGQYGNLHGVAVIPQGYRDRWREIGMEGQISHGRRKMMKILLVVMMVLFITSVACSSPFLVCDPSPEAITTVEIEITRGGATTVSPGTYIITGSDIRLYDLAGFPNGAVTFRARWADASGWWSEWSDPLNAVKSGKPGNFRIK